MRLMQANILTHEYSMSLFNTLVALLVGVFSATATLVFDLSDPFSGSFSVAGVAAQVGDLRLCLLEDVREAKSDASVLSSSTFRFLPSPDSNRGASASSNDKLKPMNSVSRREMSPSRYGNNIFSTIYFHLLTGPLGSKVRALGEIVAWTATLLWKKTRPVFAWRWRKWPWKKKESESERPKASVDAA